jgi:hypothetical protein
MVTKIKANAKLFNENTLKLPSAPSAPATQPPKNDLKHSQLKDKMFWGLNTKAPDAATATGNDLNDDDIALLLCVCQNLTATYMCVCVSWSPVKRVQVVRHAIPIANLAPVDIHSIPWDPVVPPFETPVAGRNIANHGTHTGMYYGWLEGLPPNISFHSGMLTPPGCLLMSTPVTP